MAKPEQSPATAPKRVLLVDDDAEIVEAMKYALEAKGYQVLVARDGNQGLAMAESGDYDVLVVDRMLPKMDGLTLIGGLRERMWASGVMTSKVRFVARFTRLSVGGSR